MDKKYTHTRIGNVDLGVYAGSYCIPDEELSILGIIL